MHFFLPREIYTKELAKRMIDLMKGELARLKGNTEVTGVMKKEGLHIYSVKLGMYAFEEGAYDPEEPITSIRSTKPGLKITNIP